MNSQHPMCKSAILEKENTLAQDLLLIGIDVKEHITGFHVKADVLFLNQRMYFKVSF